MGVVKVIRIFKNENDYLYIRKTLSYNYTKMNNNQPCALYNAMTNKTQSLKSRKYPLPNLLADLCHTKSN